MLSKINLLPDYRLQGRFGRVVRRQDQDLLCRVSPVHQDSICCLERASSEKKMSEKPPFMQDYQQGGGTAAQKETETYLYVGVFVLLLGICTRMRRSAPSWRELDTSTSEVRQLTIDSKMLTHMANTFYTFWAFEALKEVFTYALNTFGIVMAI